MTTNEIFYKGDIEQIDYEYNKKTMEKIIFRVINVDGVHFFAEEISTGCIFPIYEFVSGVGRSILFKTTSYIEKGIHFVFYPLVADDTVFKYKLDERPESLINLDVVSIDEINKYLKEKNSDTFWKRKIGALEKSNRYMCDIGLIKDKVNTLKDGKGIINFNVNDIKYDNSISKVNLNEIEEFGYDLSCQKDLCNFIGRELYVKKVVKAIAISGKSVLLVGPSGSGKTSLVEKLALDIKTNNCEWLKGKTIVSVNLQSLVAGAKYLGTFEERMKKIINLCLKNQGRVILFIDEIHKLYGLGRTENSSMDAMNILKPYLSRGEITIIGATTELEYQEYMTNDPAFAKKFEKVELMPPEKELNIEILMSYIDDLENKYNIKLDLNVEQKNKIVEYIINITDPKNQNIVGDNIKILNPTISKNIIEDAFTEAVYNKKDVVVVEDIALSILECSKLSPTYRREKAERLKNKLISQKKDNKVLLLNRKD